MSLEPHRNALRRIRSTSDIVRGTVLADSGRTVPSRNRRVFSVDGGINSDITRVSSPSTAQSPSPEGPSGQIMQSLNEPVPPTQGAPVQQAQEQRRPTFSPILSLFGLGRDASPQRKLNIGLIQDLAWNFLQIVVIVVMLILSSTRFRSTTDSQLSEWTACDRPLGAWCTVWVLRVFLSSLLRIWEHRRNLIRNTNDEETPHGASNNSGQEGTRSQNTSATRTTPAINSPSTQQSPTTQAAIESQEQPALPYNRLYSQLTLFSSLLTLSWFLTAHILEYTSIKTCRRTSPHLWWLMFGILSIMYIIILEVLVLGIFVFVIGPILYLIWSLILVALGRHPLQNPTAINPEIGKLPRSVVDRIPLVMYIPPPPVGFDAGDITKPEISYSYPPENKATSRPKFRFLRGVSFKGKKDILASPSDRDTNLEPKVGLSKWERNWEQNEHPFVILEDNRAACAICLNDFEAPKKMTQNTRETEIESLPNIESQDVLGLVTEEGRNNTLRLEDAGEGAQPLRLLQCGHVFHKTCLDPWLTNISGRCPVCQKAVEFPPSEKRKRERRRRSATR